MIAYHTRGQMVRWRDEQVAHELAARKLLSKVANSSGEDAPRTPARQIGRQKRIRQCVEARDYEGISCLFASRQESQHLAREDLREDDRVMVGAGNLHHAAARNDAPHALGLFGW